MLGFRYGYNRTGIPAVCRVSPLFGGPSRVRAMDLHTSDILYGPCGYNARRHACRFCGIYADEKSTISSNIGLTYVFHSSWFSSCPRSVSLRFIQMSLPSTIGRRCDRRLGHIPRAQVFSSSSKPGRTIGSARLALYRLRGRVG
jgi:hypothetical protein